MNKEQIISHLIENVDFNYPRAFVTYSSYSADSSTKEVGGKEYLEMKMKDFLYDYIREEDGEVKMPSDDDAYEYAANAIEVYNNIIYRNCAAFADRYDKIESSYGGGDLISILQGNQQKMLEENAILITNYIEENFDKSSLSFNNNNHD